MNIVTESIEVSTQGFTDIIDITGQVSDVLEKTGFSEGQVTIFISGSTAAVTTIEYEPGLIKDLPEAFEIFAPQNKQYHHDDTWHDGNGFAHVRAAFTGASLTVPFTKARMLLGTWQQIVVIDFDNRPRHRNIVVQIMGE
ncbi:YjbQ family protein [bacterium]|nr:YjbQ family protein [bacterium]